MSAAVEARLSAIETVLADLIPRLVPDPRPGRGRPAILPAALLWAGMLVCILRHDGSQRAIWRLLTAHGLWGWPRIGFSDDAVYRRLARTGSTTMAPLFAAITDLLMDEGPGDLTLAPFATEVLALDETTLDPVARRAGYRGLAPGDDRLIPGKVRALFEVRCQLFRRVTLGDDWRENEKAQASDMVADLPAGSLLLTDLGYFSFPWYDALTDAKQHWIARLREKTSSTVAHVYWERNGHRDALVWLGAYRSDKAKHLVRLVEIRHGQTTRRYLTNVTDPAKLSMAEVVRLSARRWDIELAFKTLKTDLGLAVLWSGKGPVIQTQVWAVLVIAQIAFHLRFLIATRAGVDRFDVSLLLLLKDLPRFAERGEDPVAAIAALGKFGGFLRPSRRVRYDLPDPDALIPPPPDLVRERAPRYAGRRCGPGGADRRPE
ncbi:MAG: IS4 family transposase [Chloroflexota bacterium]|nr:IS4 family transposase [Chloroflexota bacterium]